jgi:hypothetical protein
MSRVITCALLAFVCGLAVSTVFRTIKDSRLKEAQAAISPSRAKKRIAQELKQKIHKIDFRNFSYSSEAMDGTQTTFALIDGVYKGPGISPCPFTPAECFEPITLAAVAYGDVTGDDGEEAMVVLTESTRGTAIPYWVYVYSLNNDQPKLLWAFATGDRAQGGLRKVYADQGDLVVELYGEGARVDGEIYVGVPNGCCCPTVFTRTRYRWLDDHFESHGDSEVLPVNDGDDFEMEEVRPLKETWIGDVLFDDDRLSYNGYAVERRHKKIRYDYPPKMRSRSSWFGVSYAVIGRKARVLAKFDDNIYFGMGGNNIRFGLFSFLGGPTRQLVISQDIFRAGTQWVISLSPRPHIIFDGPKWAAGREGDDMRIIDLDNDGVYEITVPITDFYDLQDKMSMSQIPLPEIIFKYDPRKRSYRPANSLFQGYLLQGLKDSTDVDMLDETNHRSIVIGTTLTLVYSGRRTEGWKYFDRTYKLKDKEEIRRRVKSILVRQPVYNFIYNRRH